MADLYRMYTNKGLIELLTEKGRRDSPIINSLLNRITELDSSIKQLDEELKIERRKRSKMLDTCPICEATLNVIREEDDVL